LVTSATAVDPEVSLKMFLPSLYRELSPGRTLPFSLLFIYLRFFVDLASSSAALSSSEMRWYLRMASAVVCLSGEAILSYRYDSFPLPQTEFSNISFFLVQRTQIIDILENTLYHEDKKVMQAAGHLFRHVRI